MRILLDNNLPKVLRKLLPGHLVVHIFDLGWASLPDHELLALAEANHYDLLITRDKSMFAEQNNRKRTIALIVLSTNSKKDLRSAHALISAAVERATSGNYEVLDIAETQP